MKDTVEDLSKITDKKLVENEVVVRKILLKNGHSSENGISSNEMKALKEKNLLEYVDTMVKNLKFEL